MPRDDTRLINVMRQLAKRSDMNLRKQVYFQLILTDLFIPLVGPDAAQATSWLTDGDLGGRATYEVFSNLQELEKRHPERGHTRIRGGAVFMELSSAGAGSVRINPGGAVGGELYGHEIQMLAEAAPRVTGLGRG